MGLLKWEMTQVSSKPFLKAEVINLNMDFMDLCKDRYWGGSTLYLDIKFSIHERIVKDSKWAYQLLAPNGIHIYCKDVNEAKEIAEIMYARIRNALLERLQSEPVAKPDYMKMTNEEFNGVMWKRHCRHTKHKTAKLLAILKIRGIEGKVHFSRLRNHYGWMFSQNGSAPILIGVGYEQAIAMVNSGALDIYKDDSIVHIGEVG